MFKFALVFFQIILFDFSELPSESLFLCVFVLFHYEANFRSWSQERK